MRARKLLPLIIILILSLAPAPAADLKESLAYQVSLGPWDNVARVHLVFQEFFR